jgi:hypothetical protein
MVMFVTYNIPPTVETRAHMQEHQFHVGDKIGDNYPNVRFVFEVQADCDELFKALEITGRPHHKSVMRFYGDDAKHIVGNW